MKTGLKLLKWTSMGLGVLIVLFVAYVYARANRTYDAPYLEITASSDSTVIARGRHLVFGPAHCTDWHTPENEKDLVRAGQEASLSGGVDFETPVGTIYTPNITPDSETGIGLFTDAEIARTLRYGVKRNGFALMDFMSLYDLSDQDLTAIISYLRSSEPIHNVRPPHDWNFMGNAVRAFGMIKPMGDGDVPPAAPEDSTAAYGGYLARSVANCRGCHTRRDQMTGEYIGDEFAGQLIVDVEDDEGNIKYLVTPNLTPDAESGRIANWTTQMFIARFRAGELIPETIMPWGPYSRMTDLELTAIYKFLQSLSPVKAEIVIPVGLVDEVPRI